MLKNVMFDLDGTLLPMDMKVFVEEYLRCLARRMAGRGTDPAALVRAVWAGTGAMVENTGEETNEAVFWRVYNSICPLRPGDREEIDDFYRGEFQQVRNVCGFAPEAGECVRQIRALGLHTALATNPVFPKIATESRIRWAGLEPGDFELVTTFENSRFCKPNPDYYREVVEKLGWAPEETLMVGNDLNEDTRAADIGAGVFILTPCMIDRDGSGPGAWPHGDFRDLMKYIKDIL